MAIQIGEHDTVRDCLRQITRLVPLPSELRGPGASPPFGARVCVVGLAQHKDAVSGLPQDLGRFQLREHASEHERGSKSLFKRATQARGSSRALLEYVSERQKM